MPAKKHRRVRIQRPEQILSVKQSPEVWVARKISVMWTAVPQDFVVQ